MKNLFPVFFVFLALVTKAQYPLIESKISLKSNVWSDTVVYLAIYKGHQLTVTDTLKLDEGGKGKLNKSFIIGQYELVFPDRSQKPLIINEKKIGLKQIGDSMSYGYSNENNLFSAYWQMQTKINNKRNTLSKEKIENRALTTAKLEQLESSRFLFIKLLSKRIENTLAGKIIKANCLPNDVLYFKYHPEIATFKGRTLFDNCQINDPNLLFTSIYHERIKQYLTQVLADNPNQLITELKWLIETSKSCEYNYRFLIDYWLGYFQRNKKPTSELAFEFLVNEYVVAGQTPWIEDHIVVRLKAHTEFFKNQRLGDLLPIINAFNEKGEAIDYVSIREKYQLIVFWDPNCSHCKVEVPQYFKVYNNFSDKGLSAVAFYDQLDKESWLNFIKENRLTWINGADFDRKGNLSTELIITETPTVILLDSKGKIIDKRFKPEELKEFLKQNLN